MKSPYVADLQPQQVITAIFLVQHKDIRQKKTGEPYLSLSLGDRTGDVDAKMWDNAADVLETFERDDFIKIRGLAMIHQNRLQLTIQKLQKVDEKTLDFADFFPASKRNLDEMLAELTAVYSSLSNTHLLALCKAFLDDPEIARLMKIAPAAKSMHHAYLGGLLEHVLSMCNVARMVGPHYGADMDLLLTGVLLHDIGKLYELSYDRSFGYTIEGHLLGHMSIAQRMLDEKIRGLTEFPRELRILIEHMILSHHGQLEFGSSKVPAFPEALLLHHIDNLDSKMEAMRASLERDRSLEGFFTGYNPALDRQVFKKDKYLNPAPAEAAPATGSSAKNPAAANPAAASSAAADPTAAAPPNNHHPKPEAQGRRPAPLSPFAAQLHQALGKDKTD